MTKLELLLNKSNECKIKAIECLNKGEKSLSNFFNNASEGFIIKANKLTVKQAREEV